ncbi:MAG: hypothetical protein GX998_10300 [Firmicutes bacterium]|nr:hypothetical protein [Bacillota bacterium]
MRAAKGDLPSMDEILGSEWDIVVSEWPELKNKADILLTEPQQSRSQTAGPWRVVAVRESGPSGWWQVVLAREYW